MAKKKRDGLYKRGRFWWTSRDPVTGRAASAGCTNIGLPAGMCVRCATLQTPEPSKCETEQLPTLRWEPIDLNSMGLRVDGVPVAIIFRERDDIHEPFSWRTKICSSLLRQCEIRGCFSSIEAAQADCKKFVLANLAPKPKAAS